MPRGRTILALLLCGLSLAGLIATAASVPGAAARAPCTDGDVAHALGRGTSFLLHRQDADGLWRSDTYGSMRDGLSLTPAIAKAMGFAAGHDPEARAAFQAAVEALVDAQPEAAPGADGAHVGSYPVSTAALSVIVLRRAEAVLLDADPQRLASAREAWLAELLRHQLASSGGWLREDPDFGGWGYSPAPPLRPDPAFSELLPFGSDLSSTMMAISALAIGGLPSDAPALRDARRFVFRCQNWCEDDADAALDDGGFATTPHRHAQNKAGSAGIDGHGRLRARSYGTATADGVRALLRLGVPLDHPRLIAARRWLEAHFEAHTNPGRFDQARAHEQDAGRYCWAWSVAHAWQALDAAGETEGAARRRTQAAALVQALLAEQRPDGSWRNDNPFMKEDDPLVATVLALGALGAAARLAQ